MNMNFRAWLQNVWFEHKDEKLAWKETVDYTIDEWISKNPMFLKNRYKAEIKNK